MYIRRGVPSALTAGQNSPYTVGSHPDFTQDTRQLAIGRMLDWHFAQFAETVSVRDYAHLSSDLAWQVPVNRPIYHYITIQSLSL